MRQIFDRLGRRPAVPWLAVVLVLTGMVMLAAIARSQPPVLPSGPTILVEIERSQVLPPADPPVAKVPPGQHGSRAVADAPGSGPRIAIILTGLGLDPVLARAALDLPDAVAVAWSPYSDDPLADQAPMRRAGHEIWLDLPISRGDPARFDAGPLALSPAKSDDQNLRRLRMALETVTDPAGVVMEPGAFAASPDRLGPVSAGLGELGLPLVLHGNFVRVVADAEQVAAVAADGWLEIHTVASVIDAFLEERARQARREGDVLLVVRSHPLSLDRLGRWLAKLPGEGLTLVAPSVLLRAPPDGRSLRAGIHPDKGGVARDRHGG
ncbi:divergent polysaccharide deacetylase family protein [Geminicoccus roseus]|uniref:divergent polysaccharide deacetylase family protein n=1 Tax=Geminicoccus roseus TaxID=404900 RepID=UPI000425EA6A|nr:divergent polysaccharide deacetylase family protein [Geminicoccus roseus]